MNTSFFGSAVLCLRRHLANAISLFRIGLLPAAIVWFPLSGDTDTLVVFGLFVIASFLLDAVDGLVARALGEVTILGSFLDIFGDRLTEFILLWYFATLNVVPTWFLVLFFSRTLLTDYCRYSASIDGEVKPDGIVLNQSLSGLTLSRASRFGYALTKVILFVSLALAITYSTSSAGISAVMLQCLFIATLSFSYIRAFPILVSHGKSALRRFHPRNLRMQYSSQMVSDEHRDIHYRLFIADVFCTSGVLFLIIFAN